MTPPHDTDAERVVLSGLLKEPVLNASAWCELTADDFRAYAHRLVWAAAFDLWAAFAPVDPAAVYEELSRRGQLRLLACRPAAWLADLWDADPTGFDCTAAAERVRVLSLRRRAMHRLREAMGRVGAMSPEELAAVC